MERSTSRQFPVKKISFKLGKYFQGSTLVKLMLSVKTGRKRSTYQS